MFDSNRRIGSSSSSHLYVVAVFALLLSLTHGQTQVATLVAAPDLQLENATIDMPRWHFYSEAACCWRPGCAYYDWFGGTGWNRRSFKEDYAPFENSQGQFIFEVNNDRTRMETYCRAELKYTMMDVAVNADDVIYRSTVK